MKRGLAALLLALLLAASNRPPAVRSDSGPLGAVAPDDVFEAVFRQQVGDSLDTEARSRGTVLCLAVDPGGAPQSVSREFLRRFRDEKSVLRAAECEARPEGAVARSPNRPAVIVTAGPIDWVARDEAWVTVARFRSREDSRSEPYRVVFEAQGWVSLGPIIKLAPY